MTFVPTTSTTFMRKARRASAASPKALVAFHAGETQRGLQFLSMHDAVAVGTQALQICEACAGITFHLRHRYGVVMHLNARITEWSEGPRWDEAAALTEEMAMDLNEPTLLHSCQARFPFSAEVQNSFRKAFGPGTFIVALKSWRRHYLALDDDRVASIFDDFESWLVPS